MNKARVERLKALRKFRQIEERTDSELERVWRNALPDSPVLSTTIVQSKSSPSLRAPKEWRTAQVERLLQTFPGKETASDEIPINTEVATRPFSFSMQQWAQDEGAHRSRMAQHLDDKMLKSEAVRVAEKQRIGLERLNRGRDLDRRGAEARGRKEEQAESTQKHLAAEIHQKMQDGKRRVMEAEEKSRSKVRSLRRKGELRKAQQLEIFEAVSALRKFVDGNVDAWRKVEAKERGERMKQIADQKSQMAEERQNKRDQWLENRANLLANEDRRSSTTKFDAAAIRRKLVQQKWVDRIMSKTVGANRTERALDSKKVTSTKLGLQDRHDFNELFLALSAKTGYQQMVDTIFNDHCQATGRQSLPGSSPDGALAHSGTVTFAKDDGEEQPTGGFQDDLADDVESAKDAHLSGIAVAAQAKGRLEHGVKARRADRKTVAGSPKNRSRSESINDDANLDSRPPSPLEDVGGLDDQGLEPDEGITDEDLYAQIEQYLALDRKKGEEGTKTSHGTWQAPKLPSS